MVQGPGFDYAIVDKNFVSPTGSSENNGISLFQPGVRFISAANSVKIRTTRNPQSNLVDILPRNSRVILVEEKDGWGKIEVNGSTGWVGLEYLRSLQDSDLARVDVRIFEVGYAPDYVIYYARTSAYALNFRAGPNGDYRTIRYLPQGERIVVLDSVGYGWVEIRTVSGNGFVQRKWLKDE